MWRRSTVALAPNPRVTAALPAASTFQVAAALDLALSQDPNMDLDEGENAPSNVTDPTKQHWVLEMARAKPKTKGKDNII
eukprot:14553071-Ditylum_brightwellii.AAC.1